MAASRGLKVGLLNFTGLVQVILLVRVNKVGTGTQSWQLWNETDGAEIGVITDAGAAGVKSLQSTFAVSLTGIKQCRVRAKSTTAADDPVFYDADVLPVSA